MYLAVPTARGGKGTPGETVEEESEPEAPLKAKKK